ncbi:MAG: histidine kinase [Clostridiales bacterium]|nr:histidine kinase [Clostridiales bacterium]
MATMATRFLDSNVQLTITSYLITMIFCLYALFYLVTKIRPSQFRTMFAISQAMTILWVFFALSERVMPSFTEIYFNVRCALICINFIAPLWLITILFYTERLPRKNYWLIPAIMAVPLALCVPLVSPPSAEISKLYIKEITFDEQARHLVEFWGPFEAATGIAALCCTFVIFYFLYSWFQKHYSIKLIEKTAMLLALCLPIALHYFDYFNNASYDVTPLAFSILGVVTIYLAEKRQFFNAVPSLVWNIFNETKESMAVLSPDGSVNLNKTFIEVFGACEDDFTAFAEDLLPGLSTYFQEPQDVSGLETERGGIYYEISISSVLDRKRKVLGKLVTINDVSEAKKLALAKERVRIASVMHDNIGNRLVASINNLNLALMKPALEEARPLLDLAATSTASSLMMLRRTVEGLSPVNFRETRLVPLLESVINRISASGVCADLQISGDIETLPAPLKEFIYNSCQEALTNSVVHGRAENINVDLKYTAGLLIMDVTDNGRGCEKVFKNNGLTTMESRAKALGGTIRFGPGLSGGFGIYVEIPNKGDEQG